MINVSKSFINKIREINRTYSHPKIQQSRMVQISLLILRIYLILLVATLIYKFVTTLSSG